jgi:hypothetical protein
MKICMRMRAPEYSQNLLTTVPQFHSLLNVNIFIGDRASQLKIKYCLQKVCWSVVLQYTLYKCFVGFSHQEYILSLWAIWQNPLANSFPVCFMQFPPPGDRVPEVQLVSVSSLTKSNSPQFFSMLPTNIFIENRRQKYNLNIPVA